MKVYVEDILAAPKEVTAQGQVRTLAKDLTGSEGESTIAWLTRLTLLFSDIVALCSVINIVIIIGMATDLTLPDLRPLVLSFLLFPLAYLSFGLYRTVSLKPEYEISSFTKANIAVIGGLCVPVLFIPHFEVGMVLWLCIATPLVLVLVPFLRVLTRLLFSRAAWWGQSTLIISDSEVGNQVITLLQRRQEWGISPTHLLQNTEGTFTHYLPLLEDDSLLQAITRHHGISSVVVALEKEQRTRFVSYLKEADVFQQIFVPSVGADGFIRLREAGAKSGTVNRVAKDTQWDGVRLIFKRLIDLVGATIGLILSAPLFIAISVGIKFTSKGPIFFKQERMGKNGKSFKVLKFRTMHLDAERKLQELLAADPVLRQEYEIFHKLRNDPRITSIGKMLRRYSLDEFPQLWNVIRGDMSLVGPRAYIPRELPNMRGFETEVLKCSPGVTGLWQVSGRNQLSFDERVTIDVNYQQRWSLALDIYILLKTIPVVLTGNGAS
ncbi:MAG: exopolysaccharide biosynthesis polyprenyl glycosylphosphotransferase [Rhodothermaceae bacterium]|nr:exopolysaccharide biosynthesis polyprenyl glycosylphosphotransferase [Rhodothermaceae bacterium]